MNKNTRITLGTLIAVSVIAPLSQIDKGPSVAEIRTPTPAPIEQVVEAPVTNGVQGRLPSGRPVAQVPQQDFRETCNLADFNAKCAHSKGADMARTYEEAKQFADGNIVEVCFNSNYTSQYYSNTCKMLGRGY